MQNLRGFAMDMLVSLYALEEATDRLGRVDGFTIRRAMPYERETLINWVRQSFKSDRHGWAGECEVALSRVPASCHIATRNGALLGFACYDATAKGMFGPMGTDESFRGKGLGAALLLTSLAAMREAGYAYAVIGGVGDHVKGFYERVVSARVIPNSEPGVYADPIRPVKADH